MLGQVKCGLPAGGCRRRCPWQAGGPYRLETQRNGESGHALAPLYRVCCYVRCRCQAEHTASFLLSQALYTIDECML